VNTFNVPDCRDRVTIGAGQGASLTNRVLAATGGEEAHALITSEMPVHSHGVNDPTHAHSIHPVVSGVASGSGLTGGGVIDWVNAVSSTDAAGTGISIQSQGGGGAHNNMQPFLVATYLIKT
jgi:microcystin-dependent protein